MTLSTRAAAIALATLILQPALAPAAAPEATTETSTSAVPAPVPDREAVEALAQRLLRATELVQAGEFALAEPLLGGILADPALAAVPDPARSAAYGLASAAALNAGDGERAWQLALQGAALEDPMPEILEMVFALGMEQGRFPEAADAARRLALRWPERSTASLDEGSVYRLYRELRRSSQPVAVREAYLDALHGAQWKISDGREPSYLWLELTRMRADRGDVPAAVEAARRIDEPTSLVALQVDRRFDRVVAALPREQLDVRSAVDRNVATLRNAADAEPRKLERVMELGYALLDAGRAEEVLAICDAAIARASAPGEPAYDDADDQLVWIHDNRARALRQLGRVTEAVTTWEDARRMNEGGTPNVSQALNLASFYADLGRRDDALRALADVGQASPYGWMTYHAARYSALIDTPADPRAVESLEYLRMHASDDERGATSMLVRAGRMDEAAASLLRRLADPELRNDALLDVQRYLEEPPVSPRETRWRAGWRAFTERPDVRAAVESVGRIIDVPYRR